MTNSKKYYIQLKLSKPIDNQKTLKKYSLLPNSGNNTIMGSINVKIKKFEVCNIIIEGQSYTFKDSKKKLWL